MSFGNIPLPLWSRPRNELWLLRSNICTKAQLQFEVALHAAETRYGDMGASLPGAMNVYMDGTDPIRTDDLAQGHVEEVGVAGATGLLRDYLEVVGKASRRNRHRRGCEICSFMFAIGSQVPWTRERS